MSKKIIAKLSVGDTVGRLTILEIIPGYGSKGNQKGKYSIDRINNDGNYEPSNCRWATNKEQASNQRRSKRRPC